MIRVVLPYHLRIMAQTGAEVTVDVAGAVTQRSVLDALDARYPALRGTIRDHVTQKRRPMLRFYACEQDLSLDDPDTPLPAAVASGQEAFWIVAAIAGGAEAPLDRAAALALVREYTKSDSLVKHMQSVEAAMRAYARKLGQDELRWGIVGLLHDFDYERWPDPPNHPLKGADILRERGYPDDVIYAIKSHADYLPDCPRVHLIDKALYACDELCGLITAAALVRPGGITDMTASSVKKKMKSKGFAKGVKREDVERGAADFGVDMTEHIQFIIDALKPLATELGIERGLGAAAD
jgi:putative nucleotidyltransferase with HDIG domain